MKKAQLYSGLQQVEISSFDLRYQHCRLKSTAAEKLLLSSILDHGIRDPLQGVCTEDGRRILLDGMRKHGAIAQEMDPEGVAMDEWPPASIREVQKRSYEIIDP